MASEVQKIEADGSLGEVLQSGSLGDGREGEDRQQYRIVHSQGLDLKSTLPATAAAAATLRGAKFLRSAEGRLWFSVEGEVHLSAAQLQSLNLKR